jgi:UDP-N-acetylglucosamine transferase subunit ALG13
LVFVTVGTATQGFPRLLRAVDEHAGAGLFGEEPVLMQVGSTRDFIPRHAEWRPFWPRPEFDRLVREASLIVMHGGATVLEVVRLGKVPVVMPRRKKYGEHVNDHQLELVELLAAEGRLVPAWEPGDFPAAVREARGRAAPPVRSAPMVGLVEAAIRELIERRLARWPWMRRSW